MCRLYGARTSHPTKVECALIEAQNSLIRQSEKDERGLSNNHGWGLGLVLDGEMSCEREVGPASESAGYRERAARSRATSVIAHVRRATVGQVAIENTHPFRDGRSMLAHNGHIGDFGRLREHLLAETSSERRERIGGTTDSEHLLQLLLTRRDRVGVGEEPRILAETIRDLERWNEEIGSEEEVAVNVLWLVGEDLVGSRHRRSLWYLERDERHRCGVCGEFHPEDLPEGAEYRAAIVASERITDEEWTRVPESSVFRVRPDLTLEFKSIDR